MKNALAPTVLLGAVLALAPHSWADDAAWSKPLDASHRWSHLFNRLAFGARPGDMEAAQKLGAQKWVAAQLKPESIGDATVEEKINQLSTRQLSGRHLMVAFEGDKSQAIKKLMNIRKGDDGKITDAKIQQMDLTDREREAVLAMQKENLPLGTSSQAVGELVAEKLILAIESKRQLQEVLVDFWSNHFNIDIKKGPDQAFKVLDERQVIRPGVFGNFRDLLGASAKSPAMLWYLDNAKSTREIKARDGKTRGGVNENYAREIMELHTLGVEGGYSQADVQEVARCFTGWTISRDDAEFQFRPALHDNGEKTVLGVKIPANGGQADGEKVLDILANHPSTAQFIAKKLCMRFVSDNPPASLVKKVATAFTTSKGDLRTTYMAMFNAPEFWSEGAYRAKIKSPFEYCVSAIRALDGSYETINNAEPRARLQLMAIGASTLRPNRVRPVLSSQISSMGQALFGCVPPTGYTEKSTEWVSSSALVARLNFALNLTSGRISDVELGQDTFRPATVDEAAAQLQIKDLAASTRKTLEKEAVNNPDGARLRALLLGSPEFQRR